ncbi:MAG: efflux RND transporter periplasmic adaptor subunit [Anaerolineae bacterium]|nr:efflux RND transporter periplasmic adaptor subunit [Anaerolineae bacterium]
MISAEGELNEAINNTKIEETQAWNRVVQAQNAVAQAEIRLEELQSEPLTDTLTTAMLAVDEALMAREQAQVNLEAAQLVAPFDGTIVDVAQTVGEQVTADKTIIVRLATLEEPLIKFWVEESDMELVAVGTSVNLVFEALPDDVFVGEVTRVDPMVVDVDGTAALQCWASLDTGAEGLLIISGMTVDVEVLAAEALDAVLVPIEALREVAEGQYAVFVVSAGGELEVRTVEVGLQDYMVAQILSGLELGETVSVGEAN